MLQIGDEVRLREGVAYGARSELAGEVGKVGDIWEAEDGTRCTVVYEDWQCLVWDAPADDFQHAAI